MKKVVIFGGSFNPPGTHHVRIAEALAERFDEVVVVPCGPRPDKATTNDLEPSHRAAMADMAFRGIPRVRVDLFDLEHGTFTRTHDLDRRYAAAGTEVWHFVGTDLMQGGAEGTSQIHMTWHRGPELWERLRFVVGEREGYPCGPDDLPRNAVRMRIPGSGSSSEIRRSAFERGPIRDLVTPDVHSYIDRYGLYVGGPPRTAAPLALLRPRAKLVYDTWNPRSVAQAEALASVADDEAPNCIAVIGGDGTMLHAIREHWHLRLPFIGVNTGTRGFLLNEPSRACAADGLCREWNVERHPMLFVEAIRPDGTSDTALAFNETWMERASGQAAWTRVSVNGKTRIEKLVSDGILVGTPAGSTGYAHAMGAPALPLTASVLTLIGSNVLEPTAWKWAHLPADSLIEAESLGGDKRPVRAFADGVDKGLVRGIRVRVSRVAAVELAFAVQHDMAAKLAAVQFPAAAEAA